MSQAIKHQVVNEVCDQSNHYLCLKLKDTIGATGEKTNIFNFHQHMRTFLHTFGEITSIIIASLIMIQMVIGISKLAINAINLRGVVGLRRIGQLLCPTLVINYDYGKLTRATKRKQQEEKAEFQEELKTWKAEEGSSTTLDQFPTTSSKGEAESMSTT